MSAPAVNPNLQFLRDYSPVSRILALQGGTRSGKTYSALQYIIELCYLYRGMTITICRRTLPTLRATAMRDFLDILKSFNAYSVTYHNKSEHTYSLWGNLVEFVNLDDEQKVRGRKRNILYINEVNEVDYEVWKQLMFRTSGLVISDYNPSDAEHWFYDEVLTREDCKLLVTTYRDNPHLSAAQVAEIEQYKEKDPDYWRVFGEGQRGVSRRGQIFTHFKRITEMPPGRYFYGLDFGQTNDPTALVQLHYDHTTATLSARQKIYQTNLTSSEIVKLMKQEHVSGRIYADSAMPLMIREIKQAGFDIVGFPKGPGTVNAGIDKIKSINVNVTDDSTDLWREAQWYCWKLDKAERATNTPIDLHNHLLDATRYAVLSEVMKARPKAPRLM